MPIFVLIYLRDAVMLIGSRQVTTHTKAA